MVPKEEGSLAGIEEEWRRRQECQERSPSRTSQLPFSPCAQPSVPSARLVILARPWCYYCERDFDDLKILISHQKAKHYKCDRCGRRLNTAGGLSVHMNQVHKENLTTVENALPNRERSDWAEHFPP